MNYIQIGNDIVCLDNVRNVKFDEKELTIYIVYNENNDTFESNNYVPIDGKTKESGARIIKDIYDKLNTIKKEQRSN